MLEFFAAVDPMTLPVWAVLLLSAAMYPLGFMLGAPCSACCDECKITRCHFHDYDGYLCRPIIDYPSVSAVISIDGHTKTVDDYEGISYDAGTSIVHIPIEPGCVINRINYDYLVEVEYEEILCKQKAEVSCKYYVIFRARAYCQDSVFEFGSTRALWFQSKECVANNITTALNEIVFNPYTQLDEVPEVLDYLANVTKFASISYSACACGACCSDDPPGTSCEDNVAEHLCRGYSWLEGVDCDPDPCT